MSDDKIKNSAIATFTRFLAERKLRRTPERFAILRKALEMQRHFVVDTLYDSLETDGYHVSRATVYNTIQLLAEAGIVRRHQFANQPAQYEKTVDTAMGNHHHLVCLHCGKVKEVVDHAILKSLSECRYSSFTPEYFSLYVYGTCGQCQRKIKRMKREAAKQ